MEHEMTPPILLFFTNPSLKKDFAPYTTNYVYYTLRGIFIQFFIRAPEEHAAFTISLLLDVSFTMTPHALHNYHPPAPDAPPGFEVQTGKSASARF